MHPLLVHFPIVLVILYALVSLVPIERKSDQKPLDYPLNDLLLFLAALTSVMAALMGLFLSREEGYDPEALQMHKWGGVVLSIFTLAWYYFRKQIQAVRFMPYVVSGVAFGVIMITGHQGASITHGQDFLLAPVTPEKEKPVVPFDEALVFADMVKPIIVEKNAYRAITAKNQRVNSLWSRKKCCLRVERPANYGTARRLILD